MSTNFPSSLDDFPTPGTYLSSNPHSSLHINEGDAIEALEAKVGVNNSAVTTSLDYKVSSTSSVDPGHKHTPSVSLNATGTPSASTFLRGNDTWSSAGKFGGDGSDGALNITGGDVNIDLGSAAIVVKNYTEINITGSYKLTFTNPNSTGTLVILKSQGNVTLTSSATPMIESNLIGPAGASGVSGTSNGNPGVKGNCPMSVWASTSAATGGIYSSTPGAAFGGGGQTVKTLQNSYYANALQLNNSKYPNVFIGGSGASGGGYANSGTVVSGAGGRGSGSLIIECGGALNFTTTNGLSVAGTAGGSGSLASGTGIVGGGGGGGGGYFLCLYNSLTANSGTVNSSGGTGGNGQQTSTYGNNAVGGGGAGGSYAAGNDGQAAPGAGQVWGAGGTGANGLAIFAQNTNFF